MRSAGSRPEAGGTGVAIYHAYKRSRVSAADRTMRSLNTELQRLMREEDGAALTEYALLLAMIAVSVIGVVESFQLTLGEVFRLIGIALNDVL